MSLSPGDELAGYRIEREIGRGGMGVVYLAKQARLGRRVALKVIVPQLARDDAFRARFEREARLAAAIDHPNVVPIYDADRAGGSLYLAMRFVDGRDLGVAIAEQGRLTPDLVAHVIPPVVSALDAAHARGLVHRDVKPANILLDGFGETPNAYLSDFGLTKDASSESGGLTRTGHWVGTVDYIAPEQLDGGAVDARTDVYALGCVLFQALSGRLPYEGSEAQKMWGHAGGPIPSLREVSDELGAKFDGMVRRALAKDPAERYPSAGDLGRAVRAGALGETLTAPERSVATGAAALGLARPAPLVQPTRLEVRESKRSPKAALAALAAVLVLATVVVAGVLAASRDAGDQRVVAEPRQAEQRVRTVTVEKQVRTPAPTASTAALPAPDEPPPAAKSTGWPAGISAYTTIIGSFREREGARQRIAEAGSGAGILWSSDYVGLTPGYWAVFVGRYDSEAEASHATEAWRSRGFDDAYNRYIQQP
jgi:hypothetical protein